MSDELKNKLAQLTALELSVLEMPKRTSQKVWDAKWKEIQGVRARVVELGG